MKTVILSNSYREKNTTNKNGLKKNKTKKILCRLYVLCVPNKLWRKFEVRV